MTLVVTNLIVAVLLLVSIAYHLRAIRKIDAFKRAAEELGPLIAAYKDAVDRAEASTGKLHEAADTYREAAEAAEAGARAEALREEAQSPAPVSTVEQVRSPAVASMIQQIRARSHG